MFLGVVLGILMLFVFLVNGGVGPGLLRLCKIFLNLLKI